MMDLSVILCTYNRSRSLAKALGSIAASEVPPSIEWEVLVIDNNSKDETRMVVEDFASRHPGRFRYVFEATQGKSFALNTGIGKARGRVIAFIDDDVVANPRWLHTLTACILEGKCSGSGGKILLDPDFRPPEWLAVDGPLSLGGMLAQFDLGDQPCVLDRPPFGTNMAFLRTIFDKYGVFRTDLGPSPGSEIRNEDVEFCRRLMTGGEKLLYEPAAVVYHVVPERRRTQHYFLQFWYDHGRACVRERGVRPPLLGIPRRYFSILKALVWSAPKALIRWLASHEPKARFYRKGWLWMVRGEIFEWWQPDPLVSSTRTNIHTPETAAQQSMIPRG